MGSGAGRANGVGVACNKSSGAKGNSAAAAAAALSGLLRACEGARWALETLQMQASGQFGSLSARTDELEKGAVQHAREIDAQLAQLATDVGTMLTAADHALAKSHGKCAELAAANEALEHDNQLLRALLRKHEQPPPPTLRRAPTPVRSPSRAVAASSVRASAGAVAAGELGASHEEATEPRHDGLAQASSPARETMRSMLRAQAQAGTPLELAQNGASPARLMTSTAAASDAAATERSTALREKVEAIVRAAIEERLSTVGALAAPPPPPPTQLALAGYAAASAPAMVLVPVQEHSTPASVAAELQPTTLFPGPTPSDTTPCASGYDSSALLVTTGARAGRISGSGSGSGGGGGDSDSCGNASRLPLAPESAPVLARDDHAAPSASGGAITSKPAISVQKRKELMARLSAAKADRMNVLARA